MYEKSYETNKKNISFFHRSIDNNIKKKKNCDHNVFHDSESDEAEPPAVILTNIRRNKKV